MLATKSSSSDGGGMPTVAVTGAGGFIGRNVVACLLERDWRVKAMVRRLETSTGLPKSDRLEVVQADMRDAESLRRAVQGANAVVHLAAAMADERDSDEINVGGARRLVAACRATGCARIINISTQSANARTKSAADAVFHSSGLAVTTLLPSIVYGDETSGVFGTVLGFVKKLPIVPVLGDGRWISAPVYVGDVAGAIHSCLEHDNTIGQRYDLGGPEQISFDEFIDRIAAARGICRRKLHIPFGLSLLGARVATTLLPSPPITVSNVLGSNQNTNIDIGPARRDFGFQPIDFSSGLSRVLGPVGIDENVLATESIVIAQYLIGQTPSPALQDRYAAACRARLREDADVELQFARRHPRFWPFLDAATGILRPHSTVRQRVFLMTALLEATPEYAGFFLKPPEKPLRLMARVAWQGTRGVARIAVGIPLLFWARRNA